MKKFKLGLLIALLFGVSAVFAAIYPVTQMGEPVATDCGYYDFPVIVDQYLNVGDISLTLDYNTSALSFAGVTPGFFPASPGPTLQVNEIGPIGQIKMAWTGPAVYLPDGHILIMLRFQILQYGATTCFAWPDNPLGIWNEVSNNVNQPYPDNFGFVPTFDNGCWIIHNELDLTEQHENNTCPETPNGWINLSYGNGLGDVGQLDFSWTSDPAGFTSTMEDIDGLDAADYYVAVTDIDGCVYTLGPITIETIPAEPHASMVIDIDKDCWSEAIVPTPPTKYSVCGNPNTPLSYVISTAVDYNPDPSSCDGTRNLCSNIYRSKC